MNKPKSERLKKGHFYCQLYKGNIEIVKILKFEKSQDKYYDVYVVVLNNCIQGDEPFWTHSISLKSFDYCKKRYQISMFEKMQRMLEHLQDCERQWKELTEESGGE